MAKTLKSKAMVLDKEIFDCWVGETIKNEYKLEDFDLKTPAFNVFPGDEDGFYDKIKLLNKK